MSTSYTVYNEATGAYVKGMTMPDIENARLNVGDGEVLIEGGHPFDTVLLSGSIYALPERPNPVATFDITQMAWVDPRSADDVAKELLEARQATSLTKLAFCQRCMETGVLSPADAALAARGNVPDGFLAVMHTLPAMEQDYATLMWAGATIIERLDLFILKVAEGTGFTQEFLDFLFVVETPLAHFDPIPVAEPSLLVQ